MTRSSINDWRNQLQRGRALDDKIIDGLETIDSLKKYLVETNQDIESLTASIENIEKILLDLAASIRENNK